MESTTLEKLKAVRTKVLEKFEKLSLFVAIKRTDSNFWDLVFAAENMDSAENFKIIADIVNVVLDTNEIITISKLVLLNTDDSFVRDFTSGWEHPKST